MKKQYICSIGATEFGYPEDIRQDAAAIALDVGIAAAREKYPTIGRSSIAPWKHRLRCARQAWAAAKAGGTDGNLAD